MGEYFAILIIAVVVGVLDYLLKGSVPWENLPELFKGFSWHNTMSALYLVAVTLFAYSHGNWFYLIGMLGLINEDFSFWMIRWFVDNELSYVPIFKWITIKIYIFILVICNVIMIFIFNQV